MLFEPMDTRGQSIDFIGCKDHQLRRLVPAFVPHIAAAFAQRGDQGCLQGILADSPTKMNTNTGALV